MIILFLVFRGKELLDISFDLIKTVERLKNTQRVEANRPPGASPWLFVRYVLRRCPAEAGFGFCGPEPGNAVSKWHTSFPACSEQISELAARSSGTRV